MAQTRKDGTPPPARDVTYRFLRQKIAEVPRNEGAFLSESEVAEQTGTSRTPVREALLRLQAEGYLQILPKRGVFVPPISDAEVRAVMQAREVIEMWCMDAICPSGEEFIAELKHLVAEQGALIEDPVAFIEQDRSFHRAMVERAGNPVMTDFYETLRDRQVRMGLSAIAHHEGRAQQVLEEHAAIVDALASGDPEAANAALVAHLTSTKSALS